MEGKDMKLTARKSSLGLMAAAVLLGACAGSSTAKEAEPAASAAEETVQTVDASTVSGTYEGTARGMKGDLTVAVTIDKGEIKDVEIKDTVDTLGIKDAAIADVPARIVNGQNISVDNTTGATMTSLGIKNAVKAALQSAGLDPKAYDKGSDGVTEKKQEEAQSADLVIVGSGMSGLSASIEAKRTNPDLNVVVLERNAYTGGSSRVCGGGIWVVGSDYNKQVVETLSLDADPTKEEFIQFFEESSGEDAELNTELLGNIYEESSKVFDYYYENGLPTIMDTVSLGHPDAKLPVFWSTYNTEGEAGESQYIEAVQKMAEDLGVDIRLNSKVTGLVLDGSAVKGVSVETLDSMYELDAGKVILATGGFTQNTDMVKEYAEDYSGSIAFTGAGSKGDGITFTQPLGAEVFGHGMMGLMGFNANIGYYGAVGGLTWSPQLCVNDNTETFGYNEDFYGLQLKLLCNQPNMESTGIYDSTHPSQDALAHGVEMGWIKQYDTLDDLAADMKLDSAKLQALAKDTLAAEGPYYAQKIRPLFIGSIPGLKVDGSCRILAGDTPIENLYGAGELIFANVFQDHYPSSGTGIGVSAYTGAIAADAAIADMN